MKNIGLFAHSNLNLLEKKSRNIKKKKKFGIMLKISQTFVKEKQNIFFIVLDLLRKEVSEYSLLFDQTSSSSSMSIVHQ
jgi:hypothetical protein